MSNFDIDTIIYGLMVLSSIAIIVGFLYKSYMSWKHKKAIDKKSQNK